MAMALGAPSARERGRTRARFFRGLGSGGTLLLTWLTGRVPLEAALNT